MGGFSCAPRCPAFLTFRDSPALSRQESDGYPVRPAACYPDADRPFPPPRSPLEFSGPRQAARRWASAPHAPAPPRWERDEEMEQPEGGRNPKHVWEGSVMRHAARRFSLSGTAPPL